MLTSIPKEVTESGWLKHPDDRPHKERKPDDIFYSELYSDGTKITVSASVFDLLFSETDSGTVSVTFREIDMMSKS